MGSGIDPKVDYAFKRVFGSDENRNVLRHLLNSFLSDSLPRPITEITLLNPFCLTDVRDDKLSILDIKARDDVGREYIVEVQLYPHANFPERLLYYAAKDYAGQLAEGEEYWQLRPVLVLCFVNGELFAAAKESHSYFELMTRGSTFASATTCKFTSSSCPSSCERSTNFATIATAGPTSRSTDASSITRPCRRPWRRSPKSNKQQER